MNRQHTERNLALILGGALIASMIGRLIYQGDWLWAVASIGAALACGGILAAVHLCAWQRGGSQGIN